MIKLLDLLKEADTNLAQGLPKLVAVLKKYIYDPETHRGNISADEVDVKHDRYVVNHRRLVPMITWEYQNEPQFKKDLDAIGLDYSYYDDDDRLPEITFFPKQQKSNASIGSDSDQNNNGYPDSTEGSNNKNDVNSFIDALNQYNKKRSLFNTTKKLGKLSDRENGYYYRLDNYTDLQTDLNDNFVRASYYTPNHTKPEMFYDLNAFANSIIDRFKSVAPDLANYIKGF